MPYTEIQRKQLKVILKKRELVKRVKSYLLGESEITLPGQIRRELQHESDEIKDVYEEVMKEIKEEDWDTAIYEMPTVDVSEAIMNEKTPEEIGSNENLLLGNPTEALQKLPHLKNWRRLKRKLGI